jgi:hypothetical protein
LFRGEIWAFLKTCALGFLALLIAVLVRWLLDPVMQDTLPLVTIFGAVAAAGRHISLIIPPERLAEQIIASLKEGKRVEHYETERVRNDGQRITVSLTISPIKDDSGNVIGASKIVRDVTQRKRTLGQEHRRDRVDRMGSGRRPPQVQRSRLQRPSREASGLRQAAGTAKLSLTARSATRA